MGVVTGPFGHPDLPDAFYHSIGQRRPAGLHCARAHLEVDPVDGHPGRGDGRFGGGHDLRSDAVAGQARDAMSRHSPSPTAG